MLESRIDQCNLTVAKRLCEVFLKSLFSHILNKKGISDDIINRSAY